MLEVSNLHNLSILLQVGQMTKLVLSTDTGQKLGYQKKILLHWEQGTQKVPTVNYELDANRFADTVKILAKTTCRAQLHLVCATQKVLHLIILNSWMPCYLQQRDSYCEHKGMYTSSFTTKIPILKKVKEQEMNQTLSTRPSCTSFRLEAELKLELSW